MQTHTLTGGNLLARRKLTVWDNTQGKRIPVTTGTVRVFITASNIDPLTNEDLGRKSFTAVDASLDTTMTHIGNGEWTAVFSGSSIRAHLTEGEDYYVRVAIGSGTTYDYDDYEAFRVSFATPASDA